MDSHTSPLDKAVCDKVAPGLYDELTRLGVTKVLNVPAFTAARGYAPCISSIFLMGGGGSYDYTAEDGTTIWVHNGSLQATSPDGEEMTAYGNVSDQYAEHWHGEPPAEKHDAPLYRIVLPASDNGTQ